MIIFQLKILVCRWLVVQIALNVTAANRFVGTIWMANNRIYIVIMILVGIVANKNFLMSRNMCGVLLLSVYAIAGIVVRTARSSP